MTDTHILYRLDGKALIYLDHYAYPLRHISSIYTTPVPPGQPQLGRDPDGQYWLVIHVESTKVAVAFGTSDEMQQHMHVILDGIDEVAR